MEISTQVTQPTTAPVPFVSTFPSSVMSAFTPDSSSSSSLSPSDYRVMYNTCTEIYPLVIVIAVAVCVMVLIVCAYVVFARERHWRRIAAHLTANARSVKMDTMSNEDYSDDPDEQEYDSTDAAIPIGQYPSVDPRQVANAAPPSAFSIGEPDHTVLDVDDQPPDNDQEDHSLLYKNK